METREKNKQARDYNCVACRRPDKYVPKSAEDVKQVCDDCLKGVNSVKLSDGGASEKLITRARELYQDDDCEIDDVADISEAKEDGGTWVQAWVWVSDTDLEDLT